MNSASNPFKNTKETQLNDDSTPKIKRAFMPTRSLKQATKITSRNWKGCITADHNNLTFLFEGSKKVTSDNFGKMWKETMRNITVHRPNIDSLGISTLGQDFFAMLLSSGIKDNLADLQKLEICLRDCQPMTDQGLKTLSKLFPTLTNLKDLSLKLKIAKAITSKGFAVLMKSIGRYLLNLEHLEINFSFAQEIDMKDLKLLISKISARLTKLKSLKLGFSCCNSIFEGYDPKAPLPITPIHLPNLKHLSLDFTGCTGIAKIGLKMLLMGIIRHLTGLESINLNFYGCIDMTDIKLIEISYCLGEFLPNLLRLRFDFQKCSKLTDTCLSGFLIQTLKPTSKLQHLNLSFARCSEVTDAGLQNLITHISKNVRQLKHLALDFSSCQKLTDEGLNSLIYRTVHDLTNLKQFILNFSGCNNVTEQGFKAFDSKERIKQLPMQRLALRFNNCEKMASLHEMNLRAILYSIPILELEF